MQRYCQAMLIAAGTALAFATGNASAVVTVTFTQPDGYVDMPFASWDREQVMKDLRTHFEKLGTQLPTGQDLKVEVLDIDLAGQMEPMARAGREIRVLKGRADWPAMQLRYSVEAQGKVLKGGEARVTDMAYLNHTYSNRYASNEPLKYEKVMLDDWFKKVMKAQQ